MQNQVWKRLPAAVAGVAIGMLLLSGCTGQPANVPVADATTTVPTDKAIAPSATPIPTPSPASIALDEPSSWLIDFGSVGPLALGQAINATEQSMTAFTSTSYPGCPSVISFDKPGLPTIVIPDRLGTGVIEQIVLQGGATSSEVSSLSPRTSGGIGIGATLDQLKAAYPALTYQDDHFTPHYALSDGAGNWMNFSLLEGLVNNIVVRDSPVISKEYCG